VDNTCTAWHNLLWTGSIGLAHALIWEVNNYIYIRRLWNRPKLPDFHVRISQLGQYQTSCKLPVSLLTLFTGSFHFLSRTLWQKQKLEGTRLTPSA